MKNLVVKSGLLLAVVLLTSCSTGGSASPVKGGDATSSPPSKSSGATQLAPAVPKQLNTAAFEKRPCDLVPKSYLKAKKFTKPGKSNTSNPAVGPLCTWYSPEKTIGMGAGVIVRNPHGLNDIYQKKQSNSKAYGYFVPVKVDGFPAVQEDLTDGRKMGSCQVAVGVSDNRVVNIGWNGIDDPKPCSSVMELARQVVKTVKGGS